MDVTLTKEMKVYNRKGVLLEIVHAENTQVVAYVIGYIRHEETLVKVKTSDNVTCYAYNNTKYDIHGPWCMYECTQEELDIASNIIDSIVGLMEIAPKEDIKALISYLKDRVKEAM